MAVASAIKGQNPATLRYNSRLNHAKTDEKAFVLFKRFSYEVDAEREEPVL